MENVHIILGAPKTEEIKPLIIENDGLIIGVDRGAIFAVEEEIKLDIALGDFDSVSQEEKKKIKKYTGKIIEDPNQEVTDAEMALLYVKNHLTAKNIYLYNWYGGRVDHLYNLLLIVLQKELYDLVSKINFISQTNIISYYLPGDYRVGKIEKMDYLSFILLTKVEKLTLEKVKYTLDKEDFDYPLALVSNEFLGDEAHFSFKKGIIALIQSRDN